eukprot:9397435-Pyramimonas_sp.AAC.1
MTVKGGEAGTTQQQARAAEVHAWPLESSPVAETARAWRSARGGRQFGKTRGRQTRPRHFDFLGR